MEPPREATERDFLSEDGLPISAMGMLTGSMNTLGYMQSVADKLGWLKRYKADSEKWFLHGGQSVPAGLRCKLLRECCEIRFAAWVRAEMERRGAFYNIGMISASNGKPMVILGGVSGRDDVAENYDPCNPYSEANAVLMCAHRMLDDVAPPTH